MLSYATLEMMPLRAFTLSCRWHISRAIRTHSQKLTSPALRCAVKLAGQRRPCRSLITISLGDAYDFFHAYIGHRCVTRCKKRPANNIDCTARLRFRHLSNCLIGDSASFDGSIYVISLPSRYDARLLLASRIDACFSPLGQLIISLSPASRSAEDASARHARHAFRWLWLPVP